MSLDGWFYMKKGLLDDTRVGPFSNDEILKFAFEGAVQEKTMVAHSGHTKGQWVFAGQIAPFKTKIQDGISQRAAIKERSKLAREQERLSKLEAQAAAKELAAAERQRAASELAAAAESVRQAIPTPYAHPAPAGRSNGASPNSNGFRTRAGSGCNSLNAFGYESNRGGLDNCKSYHVA